MKKNYFLHILTALMSLFLLNSPSFADGPDSVRSIEGARSFLIRDYSIKHSGEANSSVHLILAIAGFDRSIAFAEGAMIGYLKAKNVSLDDFLVTHFQNDDFAKCEIDGFVNEKYPFRITISDMAGGQVHAFLNVTTLSTNPKAPLKVIEFAR